MRQYRGAVDSSLKFMKGRERIRMNQLIACCGLDCEKCDARIATVTSDDALCEKTAALWSKLNGVLITPERLTCTGCREVSGGQMSTNGAHRRQHRPVAAHHDGQDEKIEVPRLAYVGVCVRALDNVK